MPFDCDNCKHAGTPARHDPCGSCIGGGSRGSKWEPKPVSVTVTTKPDANARQVQGDHYKRLTIQTWDYIAANNIGYLEGNVIKYVSRWRDKGGVADLEKARHYLDKLIELQCAKP